MGPNGTNWRPLALLCTAFFMAMLDSSVVLVALPSIDGDLGFPAADLQWVMSAYMPSFGGLLLLGQRRMYPERRRPLARDRRLRAAGGVPPFRAAGAP